MCVRRGELGGFGFLMCFKSGEREGVNWLGFFVDEKVDVDGVGGRKFVVVNAVHEGDKGNFLLLNHSV